MQCEMAKLFAKDLKCAVEAKDDGRVWCCIQGLLVTTANISKMLWPSKPEAKERGKRLRELFRVEEDSLLKDRKFGNHFEHFDERLDTWSKSQKDGSFSLMDGWISYSGVQFSGEPETLLRIFHAEDLTLTFYGERYELGAVIDAISNLQEKVHQKAYELKAEHNAERKK